MIPRTQQGPYLAESDKTPYEYSPAALPTDETQGPLGPMSEAVLRRVGILNSGQLRQLGSARAFVQVKREYGVASRKLLWALEGSLSNRSWAELSPEERLSLLLEVEEIEREGKEPPLPS